jgi:ribA/ribD-fused uncharacterized protein
MATSQHVQHDQPGQHDHEQHDHAQHDNEISSKAPAWFLEVRDKLFNRFDNLDKEIDAMHTRLNEVAQSVQHACDSAKDATDTANEALKTVAKLENENSRLKEDVKSLKSKFVHLESQSRRNNLIFNGITEKMGRETWEDCEAAVRNVICTQMGIPEGASIQFERVHRLGPKKGDRKRSIIAKFSHFKGRELVWRNRHKLSKSNFSLSEDYPVEIQNERKLLLPVLKVAKTVNSVKSVSLNLNRLYVDGKLYTTQTLHELPPDLKLQTLFTKSENGVTIFSSKYSPLSNLYSEFPFSIDGQQYCSSEQYIQHCKAMLFKDESMAAKIMTEKNPYEIMALGKKVRGYNPDTWKRSVPNILKKASLSKFQQVAIARDTLLATDNDLLGEATLDKTFGIGFRLTDDQSVDPTKWTGQNVFGKVLQEVRNDIKRLFPN